MPRPAASRHTLHRVLDLLVAREGRLPPLGAILWVREKCDTRDVY